VPGDSNDIDRAFDILRQTNDRDDLIPIDLWFVHGAFNSHLSERGRHAFLDLTARAEVGYSVAWLHGIEHLVMAPDGYVSWRSQIVEHFNERLPTSEVRAIEIARRCGILEDRNEPVTSTNVVRNCADLSA
jgi:hypothetical protein